MVKRYGHELEFRVLPCKNFILIFRWVTGNSEVQYNCNGTE